MNSAVNKGISLLGIALMIGCAAFSSLAYSAPNGYPHICEDAESAIASWHRQTVETAFGMRRGGLNWNSDADLNSDDIVDILDVIIMANNLEKRAISHLKEFIPDDFLPVDFG